MVQVLDEIAESTKDGERLTDELMRRLLASSSPEAYLDAASVGERSLSEYLHRLLATHGVSRAEAVRASAVNSTFAYQVFSGKRKIGRDNAIKLAFGIGCTLSETQRILRHAGLSELWCEIRRDAIIIYCIEQGLSLSECDEELYRLGEATLIPQ